MTALESMVTLGAFFLSFVSGELVAAAAAFSCSFFLFLDVLGFREDWLESSGVSLGKGLKFCKKINEDKKRESIDIIVCLQ